MRSPARPIPPATAKRNQIVYVAIIVVLIAIIARAFTHHENKYEKIAAGVTQALQANDLATVQKYQNAETATQVNRARVGHAADLLGPLGKLKSVKETTPNDAPARVHEFDLAFQNGNVHETMKLDPQDKIVRFNYNVVAKTK